MDSIADEIADEVEEVLIPDPYRVILRSWGSYWSVRLIQKKTILFTIPFDKEQSATWFAAKLATELQSNDHRVRWSVQDEDGVELGTNLLVMGRKMGLRR